MLFLIIAFIRRPHNSSVLLWYKAAYLTQLSPSVLCAPQWKGKPDQAVPWSGKVAEMVVQLHLHNLIPICPHFVGCHVVVGSGCCCSSCCSLVAYFSFCFQFFLIINWQAGLSLRLYVTGSLNNWPFLPIALVIGMIHVSVLTSCNLTSNCDFVFYLHLQFQTTDSDPNYLLSSETG